VQHFTFTKLFSLSTVDVGLLGSNTVDFEVNINISEEYTASIFRAEDGGSMFL
jgi:hypothetical protein